MGGILASNEEVELILSVCNALPPILLGGISLMGVSNSLIDTITPS